LPSVNPPRLHVYVTAPCEKTDLYLWSEFENLNVAMIPKLLYMMIRRGNYVRVYGDWRKSFG